MSTSEDDETYEFSFQGINTPGKPLGTGENFVFPEGSSGRYVQLTAVLIFDQWISINEVNKDRPYNAWECVIMLVLFARVVFDLRRARVEGDGKMGAGGGTLFGAYIASQ